MRNLTAGEILSQVYEVNGLLAAEQDLSIGNVVFMGMGEPLLNLDNVLKSIRLLNDPQGQQIGIRRMTVSTPRSCPQAPSISVPFSSRTLAFRPACCSAFTKQYPLAQLMDACHAYQKQTGKRISFEYALIAGFNDQREHVQQLKQLLKGLDCHLNIIPVNPVANTAQFQRPNSNLLPLRVVQ